jgi:hypothetical protein
MNVESVVAQASAKQLIVKRLNENFDHLARPE